ncbi:hypothetical protein A3H09_03795 [Candidatus Falkowbacteria bacterium RIFCSPLOWO2_12_FULL_45_13]|uniref:Uncharacterized protein n=2 Tax=Candidatus Falkowiibacteriota TaxID=1752728 RepID=A0A1F5SB18_9BACT|nr:MAG: hypothetical protein A3H66_01285 [Candidatus Falkowbacteria bacterium RIFCSPLOWO2_02_FULL_45_21]OGF30462.1 MAG: hypothetical protein A3H09_03795 [Candidatus Falkowbacteria bacterium RIFCSPLOWO2_12_FULL_45_13]
MVIDWYKLLDNIHLGRARLVEAVTRLISFNFVRFYLLFLFGLNIINWLLAFYVNKNVSQNLVVLHYNVNLGVNLIGQATDIYIIPVLGLALITINFILLLNVYRKNKFLIHLLLGFSLLINLFLIASTASIYLINFR